MAEYDLTATEYVIPNDVQIGVAVSRFNRNIVERLLVACLETLKRNGVGDERITVVQVPGAFELPLAAKRLIATAHCDAVVALGAVVRGETPHFDYVAGECARGVATVSLTQNVPVIFGVLTTETQEQALDRAGGKQGNKGAEAASAALEMITALARINA